MGGGRRLAGALRHVQRLGGDAGELGGVGGHRCHILAHGDRRAQALPLAAGGVPLRFSSRRHCGIPPCTLRALTIGIAGGTASGKTTVARRLVERLAGHPIALLDQDAYYRDLSDMPLEERRGFNFDHPDAFDADLLVKHLQELKAGRPVEKPVYSFALHSRTGETQRVNPGDVVLLEGILVLALEPVRALLDVKVFVDSDADVRVLRRLSRDIKERGRDFDGVVDQYFRTVRPMHYGFVEPSKRYADIIIPHGGLNEVAIEMVAGAVRQRLTRP
ncbi:MAG: uridine kinase [Deltaproteobacteria bacterium]|nr:MAG: uridine kinase [Deltaproteobacteria bacterium]